jgi:hypothetical protein
MELVTLLILAVLGIVAWLRLSKARTPIAGWKVATLLALAGILVFFSFGSSVEDTPPKRAILNTGELPTLREVVAHAQWIQLVLVGGAMLVSFIGAYVISYLHTRRLGKRWWYMFNPLQYGNFNRREWVQVGVLLAVSFALLVIGVNSGHGR